jgi:hypothetical protein
MGYGGGLDYVQALRDVVIVVMIEKKSAVDQLDEILSTEGVDMIQWGPADYSMNVGLAGKKSDPKVKLDMGVRHFSLGTDIGILFNWLKENGDRLRNVISDS